MFLSQARAFPQRLQAGRGRTELFVPREQSLAEQSILTHELFGFPSNRGSAGRLCACTLQRAPGQGQLLLESQVLAGQLAGLLLQLCHQLSELFRVQCLAGGGEQTFETLDALGAVVDAVVQQRGVPARELGSDRHETRQGCAAEVEGERRVLGLLGFDRLLELDKACHPLGPGTDVECLLRGG